MKLVTSHWVALYLELRYEVLYLFIHYVSCLLSPFIFMVGVLVILRFLSIETFVC